MSYPAVVTREGSEWLGEVPGLPGAHTSARTLAGLDRGMREVVVLSADLTDAALSEIEFDWDFSAVDETAVKAARIAPKCRDIAELEEISAEETAAAARELKSHDWSGRDLAGALPKPDRPVTLDEMDKAIAAAAAGTDE